MRIMSGVLSSVRVGEIALGVVDEDDARLIHEAIAEALGGVWDRLELFGA